MNLTCGFDITTASDFFPLSAVPVDKQLDKFASPATCSLYIIEATIAWFLVLLTACKYNSLSVLNFHIHISATSNTWWVIYFGFVGSSSVIEAIHYASRNHDPGLTILELLLHAFEICSLGLMLNHQMKHRSSDQISYEIDSYSRAIRRSPGTVTKDQVYYYIGSCNAAVLIVFGAVITAIVLLFSTSSHHGAWYWLYVAFTLTFQVMILFLCIRILIDRSEEDGPSALMKICLLTGVLLMTPVHIPVFIWDKCIGIHWIQDIAMTPFDILIILQICSLLFFFLALKIEFKRLCQQCHWAALNEVQRLGI